MSEKIFLTYTNASAVPYQGSVLGYHIVLNYIDSEGNHHTLEGIPQNGFGHNIDKLAAAVSEEYLSDGMKNTDSPFQRLRARAGEGRGASLNQPHTIVAEGDDLSSRWALMKGFADEVDSIGYEYRPISQNSNSFAGGALQRAGFFGPGAEFPERLDHQPVFDPARGETRSLSVPGFEKPLANSINTSTPMPFPLDVSAGPAVPADGFPVPNRPNSFNGRFGNWGTAPAGGLGDARSPVLRELEKYRKSSAPDGSAPTAVHGAPTPAFQPDAVYSPAGDFFGNFPRVSAGATPSPIAFNVPGPAVGTGAADNFGAAGRGPVGVLGSFVGDAEVRPQLHGVSAPGLSNEETAYGDQSGNMPSGPRPVGYPRLRSRVVNPAFPAIMPPDAVPPDPPEPAPLLGIFSGKPMVPLPHEFWSLPKKSGASSNGALFDLLAGLALRNPASIPLDDDPRRFDRDDQMQPWFLQRRS
ncbi:hypothetical protein KMZ68_19430 [Bradyrhizobium sediminis]|uniref:Uncharacterized protein n=1 Tax=Bradyrhizobium sediminis TaxID=2840469 RepID=A0A975NLP8_9BRAD|nr:hypothetical protein [Bradyrhizobium sediminis]QWG17135.1 hypothetical protein KMZ68_19430 [Bradyrhizobium sediminis]